jgi:maltokinase
VIHHGARPGDGVFYDAVHDQRLGAVYLDLLARAATVEQLRFHLAGRAWKRAEQSRSWEAGEEPARWTTMRGPGRLLGAEQSNSSLVFGNRLILKLFRLLQPGENPELEVTRALAATGFDGCVAPLAWIEGLGFTLGVLQPFHAGSVEGWKLATERVARHYQALSQVLGGDPGNFAGEARALGLLTADLHAALGEALPKLSQGQPDLERLSGRLLGQLSAATALVPPLRQQRHSIEAAYSQALEASGGSLRLQRIHGDYHLGQVLRIGQRWIAIDFEGEPARSLEVRRSLASPLQDVAGMLRSFDYAAFQHLHEPGRQPGLEAAALAWVEANREAFLDAYLARAAEGGWLPPHHELLLRAYELDKAVYEVLYEARHRPEWLPIPLGGIYRLLGEPEPEPDPGPAKSNRS